MGIFLFELRDSGKVKVRLGEVMVGYIERVR
jgi:hypothetical protein